MASNGHRTHVYVGLAGEGENIADGGMLRRAEGDDEWVSITNGLPDDPQVRALLVHPDDPASYMQGHSTGCTGAATAATTGRLSNLQATGWTYGRWHSTRTIPTSSTPGTSRVRSPGPKMEASPGLR